MAKPSFSGRILKCLGCASPVRVLGKGAEITAPESCSHCPANQQG